MIGDGDLMMDAYVTQIEPKAIANKKAYKLIPSGKPVGSGVSHRSKTGMYTAVGLKL